MSDTEKPKARLDFQSPEEFRLTCRELGARMHYLNRVAMGESSFAWAVADMLTRLGRVFEDKYRDEEVMRLFGDGYAKGVLAREERAAALLALMYPPKDD